LLVAFDAEHRYQISVFLEEAGGIAIQQYTVGKYGEQCSFFPGCRFQHVPAQERFTPGEQDDPGADLRGFLNKPAKPFSGEFSTGLPLLGLMITSPAFQVAPVGDAVYHYRRGRQSLVNSSLTDLSGMILVVHCLNPESALSQIGQVYINGFIEEECQIILELVQKVFFCWHGYKGFDVKLCW
jgi:hypothetical protein